LVNKVDQLIDSISGSAPLSQNPGDPTVDARRQLGRRRMITGCE